MGGLRFLQLCWSILKNPGMLRHVSLKIVADLSEDRIFFILSVKQFKKSKRAEKLFSSRHGVTFSKT